MSLFCRAHYFVFFGGLEINIGDAEIQKKSKEGNKKKIYHTLNRHRIETAEADLSSGGTISRPDTPSRKIRYLFSTS